MENNKKVLRLKFFPITIYALGSRLYVLFLNMHA